MGNYKVKVGSEAESKEAQELFVALGGEVRLDDRVGIVCLTEGKIYTDDIKFYDAYGDCKELTIPELKDMVVLKRNMISDATHHCNAVERFGYLSSEGIEYLWSWGNSNWFEAKEMSFKSLYLKPITKEPIMKEFLNTDQGYKLVCCAIGETSIPENWIEVPEGSDAYINIASGSGTSWFYKFGKNPCNWKNNAWSPVHDKYSSTRNFIVDGDFVLWQRETLNDKVETAEVARQEFIGAPFSDLPESDFEAVDDFVESNVEQDNVNQPSHYCSHPSGIECIEITRHHDFTIGNAIKYLWRAGLKDSADEIQDLEKASWYIQDKINQLKKLNENSGED